MEKARGDMYVGFALMIGGCVAAGCFGYTEVSEEFRPTFTMIAMCLTLASFRAGFLYHKFRAWVTRAPVI